MATERTEPRPLTGGAVLGAVSRITVAAAGALTSILIARLLGPDGSGGYFIAQSVVLLLTVLTTFGVEHGIAYYVSAGQWAPGRAFRKALVVAIATGSAGAALGLLARLAIPSAFAEVSVPTIAIACFGVPFWLAWSYASYVALAVDRYEAYSVPPAAQAVLAMAFASLGAAVAGLPGAVAGMTAATAVVGTLTTAWALRKLPTRGPETVGMLGRSVAFGIKGYAANALQLVNYRGDIFVLSAVAAPTTVGQYGVAVAVTSVLWILPNALAEVIFPRVAHLSSSGDAGEAHRDMVETKGLRHVVLLVSGAVVVLAGALLVLVVPVYGEAFRPAVVPGLILLAGTAAIGIANVLASSVAGRGRPELNLYTVLVAVPVTIVLYATLIPAYEAEGAALASTLSYSVSLVVTAIFYRRVTGRRVLRTMVPTTDELRDVVRLSSTVLGRVR